MKIVVLRNKIQNSLPVDTILSLFLLRTSMGSAIQPIVSFVNQGVFPFIGRENELRDVLQFSSKIGDIDSLQVLLLHGEAGIGKTRLLDESLPSLVENDATVIRAKFHTGTLCSTISVLSDALRHSDSVRRIIKADSPTSLDFVISSLVRIAQVRRLVLIVEDIHLLTDTALQEFAQIISALSGEPIGLICAARPLDSKIRGIIEPYIVDEIHVQGWSNGEVTALWQELFSYEFIDPNFIGQFQKNTLGNPLMIRMVLHSSVRDSMHKRGNSSNISMLQIDFQNIEQSVVRNSHMFTSGLTAHLSEREYASAELIASLGEIFSREAALILLENEAALTELVAKGIVIQSQIHAEPLNTSTTSSLPYIFTHTLLHKHFTAGNRFDINKFWMVLAADAPVYSSLPYTSIPMNGHCLLIGNTMFIKGFKHLSSSMREVVRSLRTTLQDAMINAYNAMVLIANERLSGDELLEIELDRLHLQISILRYNGLHDTESRRQEQLDLLHTYTEKTNHLTVEEFSYHRLYALAWQFAFQAFTYCNIDFGIWNEIKVLIKSYSYQVFQISSIEVLSWALNYMNWIRSRVNCYQDFYGEMDWIIHHIEFLAASKNPILMKYIALRIYPLLLVLCRDKAELSERRRLLPIIFSHDIQSDYRASTKIINFHVQYGSAETALEIVHKYIELQKIIGKIDFGAYFDYLNLLIALHTPIPKIKEWLTEVATLYPATDYPGLWSSLLGASTSTLHLRGEPTLESFFYEIALPTLEPSKDAQGLLFAWLVAGCHIDTMNDVKKVHQEIITSGYAYWLDDSCWLQNGSGLLAYIHSLLGNSNDKPEQDLLDGLHAFLQLDATNSNRFTDIVSLLIWLRYAALARIDNYHIVLRPQIRSAIFDIMNWLIESKRIVFALLFPKYFPEYFDDDEIPQWNKRITLELEDQFQRLHFTETHPVASLSLSMIGKVRFQCNGTDERQSIKGSRLKCILGLMTLDLTLTKPLTRQEFFDIVAGEEQDDDTKRNTVKVAVYQLRKLLGHESIIQGKNVPRLNLKYCTVDYIEVWNALLKSEKELAKNKLNNARNSLLYVLRTLSGNVVFPTLYETIFETAREEFETRLRKLILRVCRNIMQVGDSRSCELILHLAVNHLSGDQEINELLVDVLHGQYKYTEALRVKYATTAA